MSLIYSSALEITSIMACGRKALSIFDRTSSLDDAPPRISAVVITCLRLQASPISAAAAAFSPALATITTRSALSTSAIKSLVRPARSLSQPPMENGSPARGAPENADAVRKLARCQGERASSLTTRSLGASSAITLTVRGREFGALMRNLASAAELIRADSLSIMPSFASTLLHQVRCVTSVAQVRTIANDKGYFISRDVLYKADDSKRKTTSRRYVHRRETPRTLQHRRHRAGRGGQGRDRGFGARRLQCRRRVLRYRRRLHSRAGLVVGRLYRRRRCRMQFSQRPVQYPYRRSGVAALHGAGQDLSGGGDRRQGHDRGVRAVTLCEGGASSMKVTPGIGTRPTFSRAADFLQLTNSAAPACLSPTISEDRRNDEKQAAIPRRRGRQHFAHRAAERG